MGPTTNDGRSILLATDSVIRHRPTIHRPTLIFPTQLELEDARLERIRPNDQLPSAPINRPCHSNPKPTGVPDSGVGGGQAGTVYAAAEGV